MSKIVIGVFKDSQKAGDAVSELKDKGYTKDISVLSRDNKADVKSTDVKQDVADTAAVGAGVGAVAGAILAGLSAVALPGLGLLVGGPLAALLTGGAAGALTGGLVGSLVDLGIPEDVARDYEARINRGEVAVGVDADGDKLPQVQQILDTHGAEHVQIVEKKNRV
ncbi:general stress protein [Candidatus Microgenomates bacterium]|nr:general stress protein [Candidatus Microgenomates bacterium]